MAERLDALRVGLIFDAIIEQAKLLDERCDDPGVTGFVLAIQALGQMGYETCEKFQFDGGTSSNALVGERRTDDNLPGALAGSPHACATVHQLSLGSGHAEP